MLDNFDIDIHAVKAKLVGDRLHFTLPAIRNRLGNVLVGETSGNIQAVPNGRAVGPAAGGIAIFLEIVALRKDGVAIVVGFNTLALPSRDEIQRGKS